MKAAASFLQVVLVLVGIAAAALLLWEPHLEGRNAHATVFEIYFNDPFLAYAYVASAPFFFGLSQGFKAAGFVGRGQLFSPDVASCLRAIRYCAIAIVGVVAVGEVWILRDRSDDPAGGIFIGLVIILSAIATAFGAALIERALRRQIASLP